MLNKLRFKLRCSIRYQLFIAYLAVGLLMTLILLFAVLSYFSRSLERNAIQNMQQLNQQIVINLDKNIYELEKLTLSVYFENQLANFLKKANNPPVQYDRDYYENMTNMSYMLSGILELNKNIHGVYLYNLNGENIICANQRNLTHNATKMDQDAWFQDALAKSGRKNLVGRRVNLGIDDNIPVISLARAVIDIASARNIGVIVVDQSTEEIGSMVRNVKIGEQGAIIVLDEDNNLIFGNRIDVYERLAAQPEFYNGLSTGQGDYFQLAVPGERFHVYHHASNYSGWKVVSCIPNSEIRAELLGIQRIMLAISIVFIAIIFLCSSLISNRATRSLINLTNMMERFERGELDTQVTVSGHNEISRLEQVFNTMTVRIRRLIETQYAETIRRQQIELSLLQHQINPHFLYNTLGLITNQAQAEDAPEAADMIRKLSRIFRYNMGKDGEIVTVADEIAHVKNYIALQKHRFADRLLVRYQLHPEAMRAVLPRMSLQPIIENSIVHCFEKMDGVCVLDIQAALDSDNWVELRIRDNGPGMEPATLERLNRRLHEKESVDDLLENSSRSIGLSNVSARIRYLYQEKCAIQIFNCEQGLEICIRLLSTYPE